VANTTGFKARVEYEVTDGTQTTYTFPFSYLRKKFVMVSILHSDDSKTALEYGVDYTVNDLSVSLTAPAQVGEHIIIYRQTSTDKIVTWNDGSILLARDMNTEDAQMLHLQEEQQDYIMAHAISTKVTSDKEVLWDALNHRVSNVSDPKDPQDAVTKNYMETVQGGFVAANKVLVQEATKQASAAKSSQEAAKTSETNAHTSETNSEISHQKARKWAEATDSPDGEVDTQSRTGKTQSSRSWSLQAEEAIRNINFYMMNILQRSKAYAVGDIAYSHKLPSWARLECVTAGTTADTIPDTLATVSSGGVLISDGTVTWIVDDVRDMTPVGCVRGSLFLPKGYIKANGATVQRADYPRLVHFIESNNLWTDDTTTNVGLFGKGDGSSTFVLPDYRERMMQYTEWNIGMRRVAGLPNITGQIGKIWGGIWTLPTNTDYSGAIRPGELVANQGIPGTNTTRETVATHDNFNASWSNSIYGSSNTVQPPAINVIPILRY
jgi:microcystin-dependent protein